MLAPGSAVCRARAGQFVRLCFAQSRWLVLLRRAVATEGHGIAAWVSQFGRKLDACLARAVIAFQSPAATAAGGVSHEPPTHGTLGNARNCGAVFCVTPPVGQNNTSGNGPCSALSIPSPPACSAGKSFNWRKPAARAAITSEGVITPGNQGSPLARAAFTSAGVRPGLTANCAPASRAAANSSASVSVPTPTIALG